jgi:hypothetical protein
MKSSAAVLAILWSISLVTNMEWLSHLENAPLFPFRPESHAMFVLSYIRDHLRGHSELQTASSSYVFIIY